MLSTETQNDHKETWLQTQNTHQDLHMPVFRAPPTAVGEEEVLSVGTDTGLDHS